MKSDSSNPSLPPGPVLVVGDLICDHYVWGDVERISPEAPVPVLRWAREADRPGGAANVAMNLAALGCRVRVAGVVGDDREGRWLMRTLNGHGVETGGVVTVHDRPTAQKTRVIARAQHLLRIDRETLAPLDPHDERTLVTGVRRLASGASGIICSDYGKGVLSTSVLKAVLGAAPDQPRRGAGRRPLVLVDPKGRDFLKYRGADILTPNEKELREATPAAKDSANPEEDLDRRARWVIRQTGVQAVLVTRGARGMDLFHLDRGTIQHAHTPVLQTHEVYDVTGAGDTVAAVMGMAVFRGLPRVDATHLANVAAGIVVSMVGTAVVDRDALTQVMDGGLSASRSKILSLAALRTRVTEAKARHSRVVLTNGCFDLLHAGHLHLLQRARALGDLLVVAINDDASVRRLKGRGRPLFPEAERAEMLAALRFVDYVMLFSEPTPARLIRALRPDVLVKGTDYTIDQVVGRDIVERYGGRVVLIPQLPGFSTSRWLDTLHERRIP